MNDTLATINVDQLSNAVNAVVQSTAIGQVPLDPSPPPAAVSAPPSLREGEDVTLRSTDQAQVVPSCASLAGRTAPGRTMSPQVPVKGAQSMVSVPAEMNVQLTALPSAQVTIPAPTTGQSATLPRFNTQTVPTSGPVVLVPRAGGQTGQVVAPPQQSTLNTQPAKKLYMLKQIGPNWVLVPTPSHNVPASAVIQSSNLVQPVTGNFDTVVHQPSTGLAQGTNINMALTPGLQSSNASAVSRQPPPHINMNIAIHLPNSGTTQPMSGVSHLHGCGLQTANHPIRTQTSQDSAHLLSQLCNLITSTASPNLPVQPPQNNQAPQFMIVPGQSGSSQLQGQALTSLVTSVPPQVSLLTSAQSGLSHAKPSTSSINIRVPSILTNSVSNINLFSPPLNYGSQNHLTLSPLISQKGCQENSSSSFAGFTNNLDLQPALLHQGPDALNMPPQQVSPGLVRLSSLPSLISPPQVRSKNMTSGIEVKSSSGGVQQNNSDVVNKQQNSWCGSCKSVVKGCPHQKPSMVILDKAVESRARQSLPDLLTLKPSSVIPGEIGVFAKQEIQANTRFGPVVGKLADINSSTDLDAIGQKAWRIFSDGKLCQLLFTNDESCSNWMMFIKMAKNHNLMAFQSGAHIYFTSFQNILLGEELVVWYSKEYGRLRGIKEKRKSSLEYQKCHRSFVDRAHLGRHLKENHPSPEKRHKCDVCSHLFSSSSKLRTHLLTHLGVKPHRCKVCHRGFTDRSNLRAHLLIHKGVKAFTCQTCNKSFRQKIHLISHQVTHTGKKDIQCSICEKMFARPSDLSYHMKQHNEVKKVTCPVCDKRFYKDSQLMRHMKIHSGQRDYQCHLCGKGFITKYHLRRHLKSCERYEQFRRKPWPASNSLEYMGEEVSRTTDERHLLRPVAPEVDVEEQRYIPSRRKQKRKEPKDIPEASSSRVFRSSCGRPIRPKPVPAYIDQSVSPPSRGLRSSRRKKRIPRKVDRHPKTHPHSSSVATHTVSVTLYEVQSGRSQEIGHSIGQSSSSLSRLVHGGMPQNAKEAMASDNCASISVYGVQGSEAEGGTNQSVDQQQPCSTLSQLAIAVPQESPIVLDCDNFVSSSSVTRSHLESSYGYNSNDPPGEDEIHEGSLTAPLFDLGEGPSMSSAAQSMSAYNAQSFSLEEEEDDNHSDAFAGSEEHCSSARSLFMTDTAISDPVPSNSSQSLGRRTHVDSLHEDNHSDTFAASREHCPSERSLFMTDSAMSDSVASTSSQSLGHQAHGSSLTEDSLFSIDPTDESGAPLPQHSGDSIDDISVDLRAIERALGSDDEEQCTDERREDSPSENIEE